MLVDPLPGRHSTPLRGGCHGGGISASSRGCSGAAGARCAEFATRCSRAERDVERPWRDHSAETRRTVHHSEGVSLDPAWTAELLPVAPFLRKSRRAPEPGMGVQAARPRLKREKAHRGSSVWTHDRKFPPPRREVSSGGTRGARVFRVGRLNSVAADVPCSDSLDFSWEHRGLVRDVWPGCLRYRRERRASEAAYRFAYS
jgi:hypothetical protein